MWESFNGALFNFNEEGSPVMHYNKKKLWGLYDSWNKAIRKTGHSMIPLMWII